MSVRIINRRNKALHVQQGEELKRKKSKVASSHAQLLAIETEEVPAHSEKSFDTELSSAVTVTEPAQKKLVLKSHAAVASVASVAEPRASTAVKAATTVQVPKKIWGIPIPLSTQTVAVESDVYRQQNIFIYDEGTSKENREPHQSVPEVTQMAEHILQVLNQQPSAESEPSAPRVVFRPETLVCALSSKAIYDSSDLPSYAPFDDGTWQCVAVQTVDFPNNQLAYWAIWKSSSTPSLAYLSFRGTHEMQDFLVDATIIPHRVDESNLFIFGGMYTSILNDWPRLINALSTLPANTKIFATGHSLGGSLAHCFVFHALKMQREKGQLSSFTFEAITFAAPTVLCTIDTISEPNMQALVQDCTALCTNFVVNNDYVPLLPRVAADVNYVKKFKELIPGFLTRFAVGFVIKDGLLESLARTLGFTIHYRTAAMTTVVMLWAEDKDYPEATNKPCPYVLNPQQFEALAQLPLYQHWRKTNPIAQDHNLDGYINILQEIRKEYAAGK